MAPQILQTHKFFQQTFLSLLRKSVKKLEKKRFFRKNFKTIIFKTIFPYLIFNL